MQGPPLQKDRQTLRYFIIRINNITFIVKIIFVIIVCSGEVGGKKVFFFLTE